MIGPCPRLDWFRGMLPEITLQTVPLSSFAPAGSMLETTQGHPKEMFQCRPVEGVRNP